MILPLMMEIVVKRERSQREKESLDRDIIPKWKCLFQSQWKVLWLIFIVLIKFWMVWKDYFLTKFGRIIIKRYHSLRNRPFFFVFETSDFINSFMCMTFLYKILIKYFMFYLYWTSKLDLFWILVIILITLFMTYVISEGLVHVSSFSSMTKFSNSIFLYSQYWFCCFYCCCWSFVYKRLLFNTWK